jgi:hypothetical protein
VPLQPVALRQMVLGAAAAKQQQQQHTVVCMRSAQHPSVANPAALAKEVQVAVMLGQRRHSIVFLLKIRWL